MASQKPSRNRVILSSGIATTLFIGALGWAIAEIQKISTHEVKIIHLERTQGKVERQIDEMHWFFIRENKVEIPKEK